MTLHRSPKVVLALSLLSLAPACFMAPHAFSQEASSGINGNITDGSGGVIPQAAVTAKNTDTNVRSTTRTNGQGYFEFPNLPAGPYILTVAADGFDATSSSTFTIETGKAARVNLPLKVGSTTTTVEVSSATTLLNTTSNDIGVTLDPQEIENLPVQNRNLFDLLALQPGVNASQSGDADSTGQNARGGFEVNGAPGLSNSILLDGVDATFGEDNGAGAGNQVAINTVGLGAIAEFRTSSSVPPVQFGRAVGGILAITTKSGTNSLHGQVFEYFRNDAMDAYPWLNKQSTPVTPKPELRFNEFGGNVGGPIRPNRSFYFLNYEGSRVVQGASNTTKVPTPLVIGKIKNPLIVQELATLPLPNQAYLATSTTGNYISNLDNYTIEDTGLARVDTTLGPSQRLSVRFNVNNQSEIEQQYRADNRLIYPLRLYNAAINHVWTLSPSLVNEFRVGLNRNDLDRHNTTYDTDPFRNYITVTGVFNTDSAQSKLHFLTTTYTLVDNLTWIRGKHTYTLGTDNRRLLSARYQDTNSLSTYANTTALYNDTVTSVGITFGTSKHFTSFQWSAYAQDSYRPMSRLTLNYGIRYEYYTPLVGAFNIRTSDPFSPLSTNKNDPYFSEGKYNIAPRVGVIGDVLGNQKLIFRGGFGLLFLPPQPFLLYDSAFLDPRLPFNSTLTAADVPATFSLKFPFSKDIVNYYASNPDLLPADLKLGRIIADYHHPDQYSINFNANLQYELRRDLYVSLTYTALRDQHSPTVALPNQFAPGQCPTTATCVVRPVPTIGDIHLNIDAGREYYDGLYTQVSYRNGPNRGNFYYTYASGISYYSSNNNIGTGQTDIQDLANPINSRGPSVGSSRNRIAGSYTFTPPVPRFARSHAYLRETLGGYGFQSIVKFNTGTVRNVITSSDLVRNGRVAGDRPDRVPGQPLYLKTILPGGIPQFLNPAAFDYATPFAQQRYGNLGYNGVFGPDNLSVNASIIKSVHFYQDKDLRLRVESFNVINHQNLGSPNLTVNNSDFGQITSRRAPRSVQLGAEVRF